VHTDLRILQGFQSSACTQLWNGIVQTASWSPKNHENEHVRCIRQGETWLIKYKKFKLGGGEACELSSDYIAIVA
jgi:hypothetical protein